MSSLRDKIGLQLAQTYVTRWNIAPMNRHQSVAEHAYRVTLIARHLMWELGWEEASINLVTGIALLHDVEEVITGDMPGPGKANQWPVLDEFHAMVKVADAIETGTWWVVWGNRKAWGRHPYNEAPARDISKIVWYSQGIDGLLEAAADVWREITGERMGDDEIRLDATDTE